MKSFKIPKSPDDTVKDILLFLLKNEKVGSIFALSKVHNNNHAYTLITDKELLSNITPTYPLMLANAGKMISRLTMIEAVKSPVAVVLRPCELRALFELVKLEQAKLDNLLFVSFTCGGVFPIKTKKDGLENKLKEYWENVKTGEDFQELRESCRICENFVPDNADIILQLAGNDTNTGTSVLIKTEKGAGFLEGIRDQFDEGSLESTTLDTIRGKRKERKQKTFADLKTEDFGIEGLINIFGRCINCHACSKACPACYCKLCYFESADSESDPSTFEIELKKRKAIRLPADTVFYHLGRLTHVGFTCVGCGMCSDVCPTNIPVGTIFSKVSERIQKAFEYTPGKDLEEKVPMSIFEMKEFEDVED
jgi:formate dehydrogenase subunit beta